jgi:uncharacterized protein (TIGR02118 family)
VEVGRRPGLHDSVLASVDRLPDGVALSPRSSEVGAIVHDDVFGLRRYEVSSTVQKDGDVGAVRMYVFFNGRRSLARDEMLRHWRDVHAPLACTHHVGMSRYVQHVVLASDDDKSIDAIAELHFASLDDLADRFYDSGEGRRIIGEDVARFAGRVAHTFIALTPASR